MPRVTKKQLKETIERQRRDIRTLVFRPNSLEAIMIRFSLEISQKLEDALWLGSTSTMKPV